MSNPIDVISGQLFQILVKNNILEFNYKLLDDNSWTAEILPKVGDPAIYSAEIDPKCVACMFKYLDIDEYDEKSDKTEYLCPLHSKNYTLAKLNEDPDAK